MKTQHVALTSGPNEKSYASHSLADQVDLYRIKAYRQLDQIRRAEMGQFLTPPPVAQIMASMFTNRRSTVNLLDAGAGVGTLIAAYVDQVCKWKRKPQTITITAYEIEPVLARYLRLTLRKCSSICNDIGIRMEYKVRQEDFLTAAVNALRISETTHANESRFNCAILNPPY
jgi:adenine-specific DNA-methyltransferase